MARTAAAIALAWLWLTPAAAHGQAADTGATMAFRYSLKSSLLLSRLSYDPVLFPETDSATGLWRLRLEPTIRWGEDATFEFAFEQRARVFSAGSSLAGGTILPPEAQAPYRIRQLDWQFAYGSHGEWRGEIDRAALSLHLSRADVTVGRQAIGWGRGALFGAVDLFSPFAPLEADREWRRGVDAVRCDLKISDRVSLDTVAAFDDTLPGSVAAARLRGYAGRADVEILAGYRARDLFAGMTSSAAIGVFELHGELAAFRTEAVTGSIGFHDERLIAKAVAGGSYRVPIGGGMVIYGEYHYSGFGAPSPDQIVPYLRDPAFQERYLRGDTQILGRHAIAVLASYEFAPELAVSGQLIFSPVDGSGVIVPSATWTVSDRWSVVFSGYAPYGAGPTGQTLNSEFGASQTAVFLQLRMYR
jgi:hypothetical protein